VKATDSKVMKSCCAASNKYINIAEMTHVSKLTPDLLSSGLARASRNTLRSFAKQQLLVAGRVQSNKGSFLHSTNKFNGNDQRLHFQQFYVVSYVNR
jgi:hypothetical protein